jgi:hypothetical protein
MALVVVLGLGTIGLFHDMYHALGR